MWMTEYNLTLQNEDWKLDVELSESGEPNELPEVNTPIGTGEGTTSVVLTNNKTGERYETSKFGDDDRIIIKKTGDQYSFELKGTVDGLGTINATYNGSIECEDFGATWG